MLNWLQTETQDNHISNDIYMNTLSTVTNTKTITFNSNYQMLEHAFSSILKAV